MTRNVYICCDFGGTNLRVAGFDEVGTMLWRESVLTDNGKNYSRSLQQIFQCIANFTTPDDCIVAAGVAYAGLAEIGVVMTGGNLPDWKHRNLAEDFRNKLGIEHVAIVNDCTAGAIGECWAGNGANTAYVGIGTGFGTAFAHHTAGTYIARSAEFGHVLFDRNSDIPCGCGGFGHLSSYVGGRELPIRYNTQHARELQNDDWEHMYSILAYGLNTIALSDTDTQVITLGGGVAIGRFGNAYNGAENLQRLQAHMDAIPGISKKAKLVLAKLLDDASLHGARILVHQLMGTVVPPYQTDDALSSNN